MRIIIAVLISVLCWEAMADTKAYTRIEQGGEIVLTDEKCKADETMFRAYWYDNEHYTEEGCWRMMIEPSMLTGIRPVRCGIGRSVSR